MPPASFGKKLSLAQITLLRRWIEQGAEYQKHWALLSPKRPVLPSVHNEKWLCTPVDRFMLARLEVKGLSFSCEADRRTLIRRLTFDLTGLPPSPDDVHAFRPDDLGVNLVADRAEPCRCATVRSAASELGGVQVLDVAADGFG